jgi:hypothetical protein
MTLTKDNALLNLLIEKVATIPFNTIEFGRLSIAALQYLLSRTHEKEKPFATSEYEVFRYSAILAAKKVSHDAYKNLMERLPTLKQLENSIKVETKVVDNHQEIAKELEPLIKFIDFRRIKCQILAAFVEPLEIIPTEIIMNAYRHIAMMNNPDLNVCRGIPIYNSNEFELVLDESACGSRLIIEDNGKVVRASFDCTVHQSVRTKMILENKGIIEWDFIIEKTAGYTWIGVCASENLDYERFAGYQPTGWVLCTNGACWNNSKGVNSYCPAFGDGSKITVHLDMNKRTCAFTVNGTKYPEVSAWNNLPPRLYPVVSLYNSDCVRIQPHQKI